LIRFTNMTIEITIWALGQTKWPVDIEGDGGH
jgi:hypothetical protein